MLAMSAVRRRSRRPRAGDGLPVPARPAGRLDRGEDRRSANEGRVAVAHGRVGLGAGQVGQRLAQASRAAPRSPAAMASPLARLAARRVGSSLATSSRAVLAASARLLDVGGDQLRAPRSRRRGGRRARRRPRRSARRGRGCRAGARRGRRGRRRSRRARRGGRPRPAPRSGAPERRRVVRAARSTCGGDRSIGRDHATPRSPPVDRLLEAMPKAELHLHLDGSVRVDTALELARTRGVDAPSTWRGMFDALVAPMPCRDQAELLRGLRPADRADAGRRGARADHGRARRDEGGRERPLRRDPLGAAAPRRARAVARGRHRGGRPRRRGGARHGPGTVVRLIATALRSHDPADNARLAEAAARFRDRGLTGWDLAGPEAAFPDPADPRPAPSRSRGTGGLRITVHAGEWGGAAQVRRALEVDPERIAHGQSAADDPTLVRGAHGAWRLPRPVPHLERPGGRRAVARRRTRSRGSTAPACPVTLSTDDTTVSDVTLTEEYGRAVARDRADAARAVGDRPLRPRRRVRRRGDARAAARGVRRLGGGHPGARVR